MKLTEALQSYSVIFELLQKRTLDCNDNFCGFVQLCPEVVKNLRILADCELCDTSIDLLQDNKRIASVGVAGITDTHFKYECKISIPSQWERRGYYIGSNWNLLLKSADRILTPIKQAFFTDSNELTTSKSFRYINYLKLSKVCDFIDGVALPSNKTNTRTVIFERDIDIIYTLKESDLDNDLKVDAIERLLHKDLHHEAKVALVREALVKFLKDKGSIQRFSYLITNFNAFSSDLLLSYQGYVEQYTFDKVRKEYQEKQTEYIQKVSNAYSDIGAKVLAIPAGLWLAVFKLEEASVGSFGFIKNLIILMLCILCMCYVLFHFTAQFSVLEAIESEYQSLFIRLAKEYDDESININKAKCKIDKSLNAVWWKLTLSNFATSVVFILVLTLSWYSLIP